MLARLELVVPTEVASGDPVELARFCAQPNAGWVQIRGGVTGTYHIEGSMVHDKEDHWEQIGANVTGDMASPIAIPAGWMFIRVRCSVYTSGTPYGFFVGEDVRQR